MYFLVPAYFAYGVALFARAKSAQKHAQGGFTALENPHSFYLVAQNRHFHSFANADCDTSAVCL